MLKIIHNFSQSSTICKIIFGLSIKLSKQPLEYFQNIMKFRKLSKLKFLTNITVIIQ